mgnify:CR=1 FL=1
MSVSSSQVPDLMKLSQIPTDLEQSVDTDMLDPTVFSQEFCRFSLMRKGFLHSFSSIVLSLDPPDEDDNPNATYPTNIGIHSLIERATLKVGAQTVCEIEDFAHYMGYKSLFIDNDINVERESVISGRITAHQLKYDDNNNASSYTIDNSTYPVSKVTGGAFKPTYSAGNQYSASFVDEGFQVKDNLLLVNKPELRISLADLFPFLRFNQLPLFMMDEEVSIELVWTPQTSSRRFVVQGTGGTTAERLNITPNSVKMVADYIFYDGETMSSYANANREMNFNYVDYRLAKRTYLQTDTTKQILNIGGAGRIVNKVMVAMGQDSATNIGLLGPFISQAPSLSGSNNGRLTTNVRYNDHFLYPIDRTLSAIQFHDIVQTEANVPYITRDEYAQEGGGAGGGGLSTADASDYNGLSISEEWRGKYNYQAHRLNRNERINSRGIELETQYNLALTGTDSYTQRCWIELVRSATLVNGKMNIFFA